MAFAITLALRALPFAVLGRLRGSAVVQKLSVSMPVGILAILAVTALHGTMAKDAHGAWYALLATAVTVAVHLAFGRRTVLSVGHRHRPLRRPAQHPVKHQRRTVR
ncbi:branched-chain amino acid transporter permease [Streptomyces spiralis]|uniref:branched-chain amino acid transporter permease n=1 Tax=Streptomyces spiralis TaxID=66376 RepID=UPI0033EBC31F